MAYPSICAGCLSLVFATGSTNYRHVMAYDLFEWCGVRYSQFDLKEALAVLLSPDLQSHELLAQQWDDPYQPATWSLLSPHGQLLLDKLGEVSACQVSLLSLYLPAASVLPSASNPLKLCS